MVLISIRSVNAFISYSVYEKRTLNLRLLAIKTCIGKNHKLLQIGFMLNITIAKPEIKRKKKKKIKHNLPQYSKKKKTPTAMLLLYCYRSRKFSLISFRS